MKEKGMEEGGLKSEVRRGRKWVERRKGKEGDRKRGRKTEEKDERRV